MDAHSDNENLGLFIKRFCSWEVRTKIKVGN